MDLYKLTYRNDFRCRGKLFMGSFGREGIICAVSESENEDHNR